MDRSTKNPPSLILFSIIFLLLAVPLLAEQKREKFENSNLSPIETKMDLGLFGLFGGSMQYSLDGKKLKGYQDFKKLIYPLHDEEASEMIRNAQEKDLISNIFYVTGVATGIDVALVFPPVHFLGVDWVDRIASGVVAGELVVGIGLIFDNSAGSEKFNAVQRYNKVLRERDKEAWRVTPQFYANSGALGLGIRRGF